MTIGAKEPHYQNTRSHFYVSTQRLSHKIRCILGAGSLADFAHHRHRYRCHHRNLPRLETQA